jgi:hypothetical protein
MSLLSDLPLEGSSRLEWVAVQRIQDRLRAAGTAPYSLCELGLDEIRDYQWLLSWAQGLSRSRVGGYGWQGGALLFLVMAEVARRESREGAVWSTVQDRFPAEVRQQLFDGNGQPRSTLKELLEEAARRLDLRHVFDQSDAQRWYDSIYLQFGFTYRGALENLSSWLVGVNRSKAITLLLGDARNRSRSFQRFWDALRFFRRDSLTEAQVRQHLEGCPWILNSWIEDVLRLTREAVSPGEHEGETEIAAEPFLLPPQVVWNEPENPLVVCRLGDPQLLGLSGPRYQVRFMDDVLATVFRQPDGTYRWDRQAVELPSGRPTFVLTLDDIHGEPHATQLLEVWDAGADVNLFSASGRPVDPTRPLDPEAPYIVQLGDDLHLRPSPRCWRRVGGDYARIWCLAERDSVAGPLTVVDRGGVVIWSERQPIARDIPPAWVERIQIELSGRDRVVSLGSSVTFELTPSFADLEVAFARLNGRPIRFDPTSARLGPITITPGLAADGLSFRVGLRRGAEVVTIERRPSVPVGGAAIFTRSGWQAPSPDKWIVAEEARCEPWRFFVPSGWSEQTAGAGPKAVLMEGSVLRGSVSTRARPLGRLSATGAPLTLQESPYNVDDGLLRLASAAIDFGVLRGFRPASDGQWQLQLRRPIVPTERHSVLCWTSDFGVAVVPSSAITTDADGTRWKISCPWEENAKAALAAVAYDGCRLGFGWAGQWHRFFGIPDDRASPLGPLELAALVRWCRLPVLCENRHDPRKRPLFEPFARAFPGQLLSAWLSDVGLERFGLVQDDSTESREADAVALRELLFDWQPEKEAVLALLDLMAAGRPEDPLGPLIEAILPLDPLLLGRLLAHLGSGQAGRRRVAAREWRCRIVGLQPGASDGELYRRQEEALCYAAKHLRVDPRSSLDENFVKGIADAAVDALRGVAALTIRERGQSVEPTAQGRNLAVALNMGSFRQYLGMRVLGELERK